MKDSYNTSPSADDDEEFFIDENKFPKNGILRNDTELFDDNAYVPGDLVTVNRSVSKQGEESWDIKLNNQVVTQINGSKLSQKERKYLYKPEGMKLLINAYKNKINKISKLKEMIKTAISLEKS